MEIAYKGSVYSTSTEKFILEYTSPLPEDSPLYQHFVVFQTPRVGKYFAFGEGGVLTGFRGKKRVIPIGKAHVEALKRDMAQ